MALKDALHRAAKALTGTPNAAEIFDIRREAQARLAEVEARLKAINEGGPEHTRILREGSPDELLALEAEAKTLSAEGKQLRLRSTELHQQHRRAQARESVAAARSMRTELNKTLETAESAQLAYERARAAAERQVAEIQGAVQACRREGIDPSPLLLDGAAIERVVALIEPRARKTRGEVAHEMRREIGAAVALKQTKPVVKGELVG